MWRAMLCGLAVAAVACAGTGRRPTPEDDVVSVGYGTQSRRNIPGAVSPHIPTGAAAHIARVETMPQAHIPGLEVIPQGGDFTLRMPSSPGMWPWRPCERAVGTSRSS